MKLLNLIFASFLILGMNNSCTGQTDKNEKTAAISESGDVEVFYFHNTRRCATCNAVEDVTVEALTENYGEKISFTSYNLEKADGKKKAEELGVAGQTLLIVKDDKKINLTNEGFMYARSNPEKLKELITDKINALL
ncbi:MAG: nitrophenyl compound nitroreductase subunit ArsF family protein [Bacteroidales bacterium]|nr:nitrophenyl compound nitroreductase subunit ArsF family protein [Bacteroidales bacterium]